MDLKNSFHELECHVKIANKIELHFAIPVMGILCLLKLLYALFWRYAAYVLFGTFSMGSFFGQSCRIDSFFQAAVSGISNKSASHAILSVP